MNEQEFLKQAKQVLDEGADNLDAATRSRLNQARQVALQGLDGNTRYRAKSWWMLPAGGVAMAAIAILGSVMYFRTSGLIALPQNSISDLEIVASRDQLDMYENLDFYQWLVVEEDANAG
jgi:hypothetical protein